MTIPTSGACGLSAGVTVKRETAFPAGMKHTPMTIKCPVRQNWSKWVPPDEVPQNVVMSFNAIPCSNNFSTLGDHECGGRPSQQQHGHALNGERRQPAPPSTAPRSDDHRHFPWVACRRKSNRSLAPAKKLGSRHLPSRRAWHDIGTCELVKKHLAQRFSVRDSQPRKVEVPSMTFALLPDVLGTPD